MAPADRTKTNIRFEYCPPVFYSGKILANLLKPRKVMLCLLKVYLIAKACKLPCFVSSLSRH